MIIIPDQNQISNKTENKPDIFQSKQKPQIKKEHASFEQKLSEQFLEEYVIKEKTNEELVNTILDQS